LTFGHMVSTDLYSVDGLCWQLSDSKLFVAITPKDVISVVDNHVYLFHGTIA